jgi:hypothetical protein
MLLMMQWLQTFVAAVVVPQLKHPFSDEAMLERVESIPSGDF